jgi:hypothetical protein
MSYLRNKLANKREKDEIEKRFLNRNFEAMSFCNKNGFYVYATAQAAQSNKVKVFKQRGEKFLPVSEELFDQSEINEVKKYSALIDVTYEDMYLKMKNKV